MRVSSQQIHNHCYSVKIWDKQFISRIDQPQTIKFLVSFFNSLMDGILFICFRHKKKVRKIKMETWIESFLEKIRNSIDYAVDSSLKSILNRKMGMGLAGLIGVDQSLNL